MAGKQFSIKIDEDLMARFRFVCEYKDRSMSGQISQLMKGYIAKFEKEHEKITPSEIEEMKRKMTRKKNADE